MAGDSSVPTIATSMANSSASLEQMESDQQETIDGLNERKKDLIEEPDTSTNPDTAIPNKYKHILPKDYKPGIFDFVIGRDAPIKQHAGNFWVYQQIRAIAEDYVRGDKTRKFLLVNQLVHQVLEKSPNAGFVILDIVSGRWYAVEEYQARAGVSQVIHEYLDNDYNNKTSRHQEQQRESKTVPPSPSPTPATITSAHAGTDSTSNETTQSNQQKTPKSSLKYPKGTKVRKHFPEFGWFRGRVMDFSGENYYVIYEDGDAEDLSEAELEKVLDENSSSQQEQPTNPEQQKHQSAATAGVTPTRNNSKEAVRTSDNADKNDKEDEDYVDQLEDEIDEDKAMEEAILRTLQPSLHEQQNNPEQQQRQQHATVDPAKAWLDGFDYILKFKDCHGHMNIPPWGQHRALHLWIQKQVNAYHEGNLTPQQQLCIGDIGVLETFTYRSLDDCENSITTATTTAKHISKTVDAQNKPISTTLNDRPKGDNTLQEPQPQPQQKQLQRIGIENQNRSMQRQMPVTNGHANSQGSLVNDRQSLPQMQPHYQQQVPPQQRGGGSSCAIAGKNQQNHSHNAQNQPHIQPTEARRAVNNMQQLVLQDQMRREPDTRETYLNRLEAIRQWSTQTTDGQVQRQCQLQQEHPMVLNGESNNENSLGHREGPQQQAFMAQQQQQRQLVQHLAKVVQRQQQRIQELTAARNNEQQQQQQLANKHMQTCATAARLQEQLNATTQQQKQQVKEHQEALATTLMAANVINSMKAQLQEQGKQLRSHEQVIFQMGSLIGAIAGDVKQLKEHATVSTTQGLPLAGVRAMAQNHGQSGTNAVQSRNKQHDNTARVQAGAKRREESFDTGAVASPKRQRLYDQALRAGGDGQLVAELAMLLDNENDKKLPANSGRESSFNSDNSEEVEAVVEMDGRVVI
ncbi:expressed unknown protein [Seminavis robusta]|uniref:Uncharacterized protein n=1 Tax=Seminavis robusta TaxID=568900 RepID=A0A9N8HJ69_9STRA|nr:expressed unknown protein [Seminavis robusta]|eukprot:Sro744_g196180.1 n/a (913) ;mRNA; f:15296-18034